jgi:hypothetical protein
MKSNKSAVMLLAAAAFSGAMFTASAQAGESASGFSALQGVTAEAMSVDEMQAATGEGAIDLQKLLANATAALSQFKKAVDSSHLPAPTITKIDTAVANATAYLAKYIKP